MLIYLPPLHQPGYAPMIEYDASKVCVGYCHLWVAGVSPLPLTPGRRHRWGTVRLHIEEFRYFDEDFMRPGGHWEVCRDCHRHYLFYRFLQELKVMR